ncbi:MAG: hypothetical protein M0R03_18875, partial [Novosphingobium sp.]|nr:hypothetical protein [Novosphingobium sp.]
KPKLPEVPPFLLVSGAKLRPGLSAKTIASNIIKRQSEANAHSGKMADGSDNIMEKMYVIIVEEIINAIVYNAKVDVAVDIGAIKVIAQGGNAGGPIVVQGTNVMPASGYGTIR